MSHHGPPPPARERWPLSLPWRPGRRPWAQDNPLPSWNDGPAKQAILDFVAATTTEGSALIW